MWEFFSRLFASDFMPHGHCYFWRPEIVWLHVISDALIAASYFIIPFGLIYFARRRRDLTYHYPWMFVLFGIFILSCGTTHVMQIWTLWHGTYRLDGVIKAITALASFPTAILLIRLLPTALKLQGPEQLQQLNVELERRVAERTLELQAANLRLREANRALESANTELSHFAYSASHDMQEPLRMMAIYSQALERRYASQIDQQARQYLHFIVNGAQRMESLIADILGYAALNQDTELELAPTNVAAVIDTVRGDLGVLIASTEAEILVELPNVRVLVPERRVAQLFQNLFTNAIKYHKPGQSPRIRVSAQPQGHSWRFRVEDDGIGIAPEYHQEIFLLFKRLHPRDEYEGSGIGLATCQKIVERYGGSLRVESELGQGATFVFTLPAALEKTGERA
ncbi:MAG: hypothetical protein JNK87_23135 [Bryobacterales bacterium]|nr:hypothetical protein [Bryobacterales bacterium]